MSGPVILLPLDGTPAALAALPVARAFATLGRLPLRFVHVSKSADDPARAASRVGLPAAELHGGSLESRPGDPAAEILAAASQTQARLIVMCTHSTAQRPAGILGRTALAVLQNAPCPVVLVNPAQARDSWSLRKLLAPHEGSPETSSAVRPGAELARKAGAELLVLLVAASGDATPRGPGSIAPPAYLDQPQHEWPAWAHEFLDRLACACPLEGLKIRLLLGRGAPAEEIVRVARAESADLILLAWKGAWGPERAVTLKAVIKGADCPVMVVRV